MAVLKIKSPRLRMIFKGLAVPCGSGCFQTWDGSQFLGKLKESDIQELYSINENKITGTEDLNTILRLKKYIV